MMFSTSRLDDVCSAFANYEGAFSDFYLTAFRDGGREGARERQPVDTAQAVFATHERVVA
jgi:hypothetical protein